MFRHATRLPKISNTLVMIDDDYVRTRSHLFIESETRTHLFFHVCMQEIARGSDKYSMVLEAPEVLQWANHSQSRWRGPVV